VFNRPLQLSGCVTGQVPAPTPEVGAGYAAGATCNRSPSNLCQSKRLKQPLASVACFGHCHARADVEFARAMCQNFTRQRNDRRWDVLALAKEKVRSPADSMH
jgi:hypothetical protein